MASTNPASTGAISVLRTLVAVLVCMALVLGPTQSVAAMGAQYGALTLAGADLPICHASSPEAGDGDQAPVKSPGHAQDCRLCPACQLATQPALVLGNAAFFPVPAVPAWTGFALLPPATGPPSPVSLATPPTGPPAFSV